MEKKVVQTADAPAAIGPYSQANLVGNLVFTSGQIPLDARSGQIVADDFDSQARQVLSNLRAVLEAAGSSLDKVVKTIVFLADMNDFSALNAIYGEYFTGSFPARSAVQVARLPKDVRVEVEAIATL
jgi:2-iminobutanoate/2-iminopropanoate deaminase